MAIRQAIYVSCQCNERFCKASAIAAVRAAPGSVLKIGD